MSADGTTFKTELMPGQRLVAGKLYTFDADALNDHLAQERIETVPCEMSGLTDDELTKLFYAAIRLNHGAFRNRPAEEVLARVCAERAKRERRSELVSECFDIAAGASPASERVLAAGRGA